MLISGRQENLRKMLLKKDNPENYFSNKKGFLGVTFF